MKYLFLFLALPFFCTAQGSRSLNFGGGQGATASMPSTPFATLADFRLEIRLIGVEQRSTLQTILTVGALNIEIPANSSTIRAINLGETMVHSFAGRTDFVIRLQKTASLNLLTFQIWDSTGGNLLTSRQTFTTATINFSGNLKIGKDISDNQRTLAGSIAYCRWFTTVVGDDFDSAVPGNVAGGDGVDYEFENNGNDGSGRGLTLSLDVTGVYSDTPTIAILPQSFTVRAGFPFSIDGSRSAASSYFWQQLSGPDTLTFSSRTTAIPTITGAVAFGSYVIQLRVTNAAGNSDLRTVKVGAVPTNSEGVVQVSDDKVDFILGPQLRDGLSPWPFYDAIRKSRGVAFGETYASLIAADFDSPAAGTISVTNGSTTVTGTGTAFTSLFTCTGIVLSGEAIVINYPDGSGGFGRRLLAVVSCPSPTSIIISAPYAYPSAAGVQYTRWDAATSKRWSEGINYYDSVLVQYQNYYRTGIDDFLAYGRTLADGWWRCPQIDGGRDPNSRDIGFMAPRRVSMAGQLLRYMDGKPEYLTWLKANTDVARTAWIAEPAALSGSEFGFGTREAGYAYWHVAIMAKVHPDAGVRTGYLANLNDFASSYWRAYQCKPSNPAHRCQTPLGAFRWPDPGNFGGNAQLAFHDSIAMEGIARAHILTGNSTLATVMNDFATQIETGTTPGGQTIFQRQAGFGGLPCQAFQYWSFATANSTGTDANGNNIDGASCSTLDSIRDNRSLSNLTHYTLGYLGKIAFGDEVFAANFGRTQGPLSDGRYGLVDALASTDHGKQHGQSLRSSGNYLAQRVPVIAPVSINISVGFSLASFAAATSARVVITGGNGKIWENTCSASPCVVSGVITGQGDHTMVIQYRSAALQVVASSSRTRLAME